MKRICVIGAGASGLPTIKCCLDEKLNPVCYEKSHDIGGLWRYEEDEKEEASIYKSVVINSSKEMMCYSDFPIPKEFANFMHHFKVLEYMRLYAKHFNLQQHIKFHTEVLKCEAHEDWESTGRWSSKVMASIIPKTWINASIEKEIMTGLDYALYGLKPKHRPFSQHPLMSDYLPNAILSGLVVIKGNVKEFTENGVIFEDGTSEEVDAVIFSTGYKFNFPFLDDAIIKVRNNECRLYRHVWPPQLKHGSLAVIGKLQPLGPISTIAEMQSRWATRVFKGTASLPSRGIMEKTIEESLNAIKKSHYRSQRHTMEVDYVEAMDEIADEIGIKPDVIKIFMQDFQLGMKHKTVKQRDFTARTMSELKIS